MLYIHVEYQSRLHGLVDVLALLSGEVEAMVHHMLVVGLSLAAIRRSALACHEEAAGAAASYTDGQTGGTKERKHNGGVIPEHSTGKTVGHARSSALTVSIDGGHDDEREVHECQDAGEAVEHDIARAASQSHLNDINAERAAHQDESKLAAEEELMEVFSFVCTGNEASSRLQERDLTRVTVGNAKMRVRQLLLPSFVEVDREDDLNDTEAAY